MPNSRRYNWRHNALIGSATRGHADIKRIIYAPSATPETKELALRIYYDMQELEQRLRTERINQDGTAWKKDAT